MTQFFSAVLFDMDGTLVDSEPMWLISETELMARYGYVWKEIDQANCLGGPLDRVGRYMSDLVDGIEKPEFFTESLIKLMATKLRDGAAFMEGAKELMDLCDELEIPMALVSASPRVLVDAVLENIDDHNFAVSISSSDVVNVKPNPEGYIAAANFIGVPIQECLILEDSLTGISAAISSGGMVVAIPHLVPIEETRKIRVVGSVRELTFEKLQSFYQGWNS